MVGNLGRSTLLGMLAVCATGFAPAAVAANHALIMAIDAYEGPPPLPEVALDVSLAREIARRLGVPQENTVVRRNRELNLSGMRTTLKEFLGRVQTGDQVFLYYSGHGARVSNPKASTGCTEAMVSVRGELLLDIELADWMTRLTSKADRVVFLNDSCFAGGAVTRGLSRNRPKLYKAKNWSECSDPVNVKSLFKKPQESLGVNAVYVAASADNEVAFTSPKGSVATVAWLACLGADNHAGVNGDQLRACAQKMIDQDRNNDPQTITVLGNNETPLALLPGRR